MDVESWFFPIEGEYVDKFTNYPDSKYTFEKLGNANKLNEYLSNTDFGKYAKQKNTNQCHLDSGTVKFFL